MLLPPASRGRGGVLKSGKVEAIRRLPTLKRRIVVLTVVGFGVLSGLAAGHHVGVTARDAPGPSTGGGSGFFNQGGTEDQGAYGYGFGSGGVQGPVAGSGVS